MRKVFQGVDDSIPNSSAGTSAKSGVQHGWPSRSVSGGNLKSGNDTRPSSEEKQGKLSGMGLPKESGTGRMKETNFG